METTRETMQEFVAQLIGVRPYIVLESDRPPQSIVYPGAIGCTSRGADLALQPWLMLRGEWRGRAPAVYLADQSIRKLARDEAPDDPVRAATLERALSIATLVHELGHIVNRGIDLSEPTAERRQFATAVAAYTISVADNPPWPPFWLHTANWIRLSLHLCHRASRLGCPCDVDLVFAGEAYCVAEPADFLLTLADEPEALHVVPIFDICSFTPPVHYRQLWNECVNRWIDQQPDRALSAVRAASAMLLPE